jgi:hypothetical protein
MGQARSNSSQYCAGLTRSDFDTHNTQETITFELDSYFGHFYPSDEWLILASGYRLLLISPTGSVAWKTEELGLDGVIVDSIADGLIHGQGEWEPPGGWRPFQVRLDTGEKIGL